MYGRGNHDPPLGHGLQRPMPLYQQQLSGHPSASHFQTGNSLQPLNQQGGPPHGAPPLGPSYLHAPPAPLNMPQQGPPVSTSNTGHYYLHPPLTAHNGVGVRLPLLAAQQNFVSRSQNPHLPPHPPPSMGPRVPPAPPFMQLPPPPPQTAPVFSPVNFESAKPQSAETHMPGVAPQPPPLPPSLPPSAPPPPPSSCSPLSPEKLPTPTYIAAKPPIQSGHDPNSDRVLVSESSGNIPTHSLKSGETQISDEDMSLKQSVLVDLPPPPTPPPKPADENIVRNIEVLCQFIAKNGSEFEEMVREKESGNPEFNFLVGGDPGSDASRAHEYFLWMKKKRNIENNLHKDQNWRDLVERDVDVNPSPRLDSLSNIGKAHSPADSDVDMEDDITQSDKDHGVYYSVEDEEPESVLAGDIYKRSNQENDNELQHLRDYSPAPMSSPSVKHQVDSESMPEKPAVQCTTIHSPFRMIQNYASDDSADDDAEPCHENVKARVVSPLGKASSSHDGVEHINTNCKRNVTSEIGLGQSVTTCSGSGLTKERADMQQIQGDLPEAPARMLYGKCKTNDLDGRIEGPNTNTFHGNYASRSTGVGSVSIYKDEIKGEKKDTATAAKVDEFGRLVKEGASESESDDSHHLRRRGRRDRSRSCSRSRSPSDRRRRMRRSRRKSPRRRKERRSRSRSWSPKRRRSRSRSPYRSGGDFRADKLRRGKIQNCFDFLKGRCYRGASCRYVHHESDKIEISRGNNSKQHQIENVACVPINSPQEHADRKVEKMHLDLDKRDSHNLGLQTSDERSKAEFIDDALQPSVPHLDSEKVATDIKKCDGVRSGDQVAGASDEPTSHLPIFQEHSSSGMPPTNAVVLDPQAQGSAASNHRLNEEPQKMDNSSKVDSSTVQTSSISLSGNEPSVHKMSDESTAPNASVLDFSHQVSNLPPPPLVQQATNAPQGPNIQENHNLVAPSSSFHPHSVPIESGPLYQQSQNSVPPHPAWNTLLQPRPPNMVGPSIAGDLLQYQQGDFPLRNDFPGHFQMGGFSHQTYHLPSINIPAQPFAGSNLVRDDRYSQFPTQSRVPSSSFVPGVAPQPVPFQGDSTVRNTQSFPGDNLLMGESSKPFFQNQNHQFVQQRMPPFGAQLTASESMPSHFGGSVSVPGYSSNVIDRDKSTYFDVGESRISTHYNPYASTFDQPLSTRFSSIATGGIKYDSSFGLGHAPIDGQTAGDHGSKRFISSSKAEGKTVLKSGGDQYDPSFDSIDPFSDSIKKHAEKQDHAADNSDIMLKLSSRHIVLAVEENKQKLVGAAAATVSLENDEFGETADAEVGAVENGSPSNSNEDADVADGDTEIDQVKSEGRSKKNKDSRSMKLFKVAVTNFVKEVLKPQWRQGNMSKEVFKTIVKKTVDKVSGAMKNHRLPKSQAKIDHYIDSSRRKLTQLVQGYVSKYKS